MFRKMPFILLAIILVSGLQPNVDYNLYKYNNFEAVPNSNFNAQASHACEIWYFQSTSTQPYVLIQQINSNEIAIYRAVKTTAP